MAVFSQGGDDYLEQIEMEALKVGGEDGTGVGGAGIHSNTTIEQFESELERHYRGSFMFYEKLPRRSKEEIFLDYKKGASIDGIRQKIVNRFRHDE